MQSCPEPEKGNKVGSEGRGCMDYRQWCCRARDAEGLNTRTKPPRRPHTCRRPDIADT